MYVCVGRGGMLCGVPMHSRSRLQTNARGVETGIVSVACMNVEVGRVDYTTGSQ